LCEKSIVYAGLDPETLPKSHKLKMSFGLCDARPGETFGAGQGIRMMNDVTAIADMVPRVNAECDAAPARLAL